ncbi:30S ribosomal protein S5 [Geodia barretti]|uniref:Small ribosomal subunit protein uS5c n=2 Tax=Geodia barretti TaxID=519541 RepID=A0AA35R0Q2_GEOBA|nr:30S ribosomal protein S5 [Geodia barretti]
MVTQTNTRDRRSDGDRRGRQRRRPRRDEAPEGPELFERAVKIRRVSKVVKGGRNLSFSAMMVVGDYNGRVGAALGKAASVPDAVRKGRQNAERAMEPVTTLGGTIPHEVFAKYGSAKVLLLPAKPGTGVIAGGGVRAVIEAAGIQDVLSKTYGGSNPVNTVRATLKALSLLKDPQRERARRLGLDRIHTPEVTAPEVEPVEAASTEAEPVEVTEASTETSTEVPADDANAETSEPVSEEVSGEVVATTEPVVDVPTAEDESENSS